MEEKERCSSNEPTSVILTSRPSLVIGLSNDRSIQLIEFEPIKKTRRTS